MKESDSQLKSWVPSTRPEDIFSRQYESTQNGVEHDARSILQQSRPYQDGANRGSVSQDGSAGGGGDQPVMPYCLKRALDEPPVPPLSPPGSDETRSLQDMSNGATAPSTHQPGQQQQQRNPEDDEFPSHLVRVDVSNWMKTEEPLISNLGTIAMGNYPALGLNTQFRFPAPTVTGGGNGGGAAAAAASAGQYTMPYVIQDEDWRGL